MAIALPFEEWSLVEPIVTDVFKNAMPQTRERAGFVVEMDQDNQLAGFVHVESLYHMACVYVAPRYEKTGLSLSLIAQAGMAIPPGYSGIWMTERNVDRIAAKVGARYVGTYRIYRKDK